MHIRHVAVVVVLLVIGLFALVNWSTIAAPTTLDLLVGQVQAPLGLLMLGAVAVLTIVYALLLVVVERRLLRESRDVHRALDAERRRTSETQTEDMRDLSRVIAQELDDVRGVLGRLVSQVTELRRLATPRAPSADHASTVGTEPPRGE